MQLSLRQNAPVAVVTRRELSAAAAVGLFYAGLMIETVGIALVPAFGWSLIGTLTAVCGLAIAETGIRHTPREERVSSWAMLTSYLTTWHR